MTDLYCSHQSEYISDRSQSCFICHTERESNQILKIITKIFFIAIAALACFALLPPPYSAIAFILIALPIAACDFSYPDFEIMRIFLDLLCIFTPRVRPSMSSFMPHSRIRVGDRA